MSEPTLLEALYAELVQRPIGVAAVTASALVFGWVGYASLPVELMPELSYPTLTVRTLYEGAAPEEVETQVSRPVEEAVATLDGLVSLQSRSRAGASDVVLDFDWGTDVSKASQTVRENLQTTWLPEQADRPLLLRYDPSLEPFLRLALAVDAGESAPSGDDALFLLRELADGDVRRALEGVEGVAAVRIRGGLEREIRVQVRQDWLAARQVRIEDVRNALASENVNLAGGSILEGDVEYLVRTLNEYRGIDEIREVRVRRSDGTSVPITAVATIVEASVERTVLTHLDGGEAVEVELFKEADANVVEVAQHVRQRLYGPTGAPLAAVADAKATDKPPGLVGELPDGTRLEVLDDQAVFIEEAIDNLAESAIEGGLLAVAVLWLFLGNLRSTGIIGAAIPISLVMVFGPLYVGGITLNLMSLGGLALGVGMLVDNSVVVLDSIQVHMDAGKSRTRAAIDGTAEVAVAMAASMTTNVCVFLPMGFVEGMGGQLFGDLSWAVVVSNVAALVVALLIVPVLAALGGGVGEVAPAGAGVVGVLTRLRRGEVAWRALPGEAWRDLVGPARADWAATRQVRGWRRIVWPWALTRMVARLAVGATAWAVVLPGTAVMAVSWTVARLALAPVVWAAGLAARAFNAAYAPMARLYVRSLAGAIRAPWVTLGLAGAVVGGTLLLAGDLGAELVPTVHRGRFVVSVALPVGAPLQRTLGVASDVERVIGEHPGVSRVYTTVGVDRSADASADEGENTAKLRVVLEDGWSAERVMADLRDDVGVVPTLQVRMEEPSLFTADPPIEVVVTGYDLDLLAKAGEQVRAAVADVPGVRDVKSSLGRGYPEVRLRYDRDRLQRLGLDPSTVADRVRDAVQGVAPTALHRGDRRVDLSVRLDERDRQSLADLRAFNVNPQLRPPIPLESVAEVTEAEGPSEVRRVDQQRAVVVTAELDGFDLGSAVDGITARLGREALPGDVDWSIRGQSEELERSRASLYFALALALFLVYVAMAATFESLIQPFVILFSVPVAIVGVVIGLWLSGTPASIVVFLGLIVLAGVVVNNAIVLLDAINRLRSEGQALDEAVVAAGELRLRPILITAATSVLGLVPLVLGYGAGAELQRPLAITVVGGLSSSTLLTLLVVPAVYRIIEGRARAA